MVAKLKSPMCGRDVRECMRHGVRIAFLSCVLLMRTTAHAQVPPPGAPLGAPMLPPIPTLPPRTEQDSAQRLLQEQNNKQLQQQLQQAPAQIEAPSVEAVPNLPAGADVESLADVEPTFLIHQIEFVGKTVLSQRELAQVTQPFIGKKLGRNRIGLLLRRLTEAFIAHGYITTRAYLGQQNLSSGVLTIHIVPGRIEGYALNKKVLRPLPPDWKPFDTYGGGLLTDAGTAWAFPDGPGAVLDLPDLEQGVEQINRLRRNQAQIQILPGQSPGDSVVAITNPYGDRLYYNLGMDNYGSSSTGTIRYRAGIEADNLIGLQESLSLSYVGTRDSNALVFSGAVPYGFQTFSYTLSMSEYQQLIGTSALLIGQTFSQILGWTDMIERSSSGNLSLDTTFTTLRSYRDVNDIELDPQNLSVLRIGLSGLHRFTINGRQAAFSIDGGVARGLPWLSASRDAPGIDETDAHSQFTRYDASSTWQLPAGTFGSMQFAYHGSMNAQYSRVALFSNEQIYLGGMDSIRGFTEGGITGDSGVYVRNEYLWSNAPLWHGGHFEPYVFLDSGKAHLDAQGGWPTLTGTGVGVRTEWQIGKQAITSEVLLGQAINQPAALGHKATVLLATLNWSE